MLELEAFRLHLDIDGDRSLPDLAQNLTLQAGQRLALVRENFDLRSSAAPAQSEWIMVGRREQEFSSNGQTAESPPPIFWVMSVLVSAATQLR